MTSISQKWSSNYHVKPQGSKMVITIGKGFFKKMKKVPKRFKTVPKWTKLHKIQKKKIKNLTLERNHCVKNGNL
jgi:hypothetical protein